MPNLNLINKKLEDIIDECFYEENFVGAKKHAVQKLKALIHSSNKRARIDEAKRLLDYSLNYTDGVVGIRELEEHIQDLEASLKGEDSVH